MCQSDRRKEKNAFFFSGCCVSAEVRCSKQGTRGEGYGRVGRLADHHMNPLQKRIKKMLLFPPPSLFFCFVPQGFYL